jgi:DNA-binding Lrp family transcriptional regulator
MLFPGLHGVRDALIRELVHSAARSNEQIARMLGVSEATVRRVIAGK